MSVIEEVRCEREELARVLKKHPGIRKIVEDLYPDSAHFIYELLQNAEDTGATNAQFTLSKYGLVFEHNGRPFESKDIYAITDVGEGSKANDDDKIGRFGVGFKAVFAYSESPHIWSSSFSFKITDLVLPSALEPKVTLGNKTRFEFPFNNPKKMASIAYDEINAGLKDLAETTLLFLSHLESIRWQNTVYESGEIFRSKHSENHFEVIKQENGNTTASSHFLKFDQPVRGLEKQRIAVAYALEFLPNLHHYNSKLLLAKQFKIIPAMSGKVAVFFPAEKETSGLRFHLHAPFVPELSRASIKETDANLPLFEQLTTLVVKSLYEIRNLSLLTADFLSVLPNPQDSIPKRYQRFRDAIIEEMNEQPLTPTHEETHAPAKYLLQAKASLKNLLSKDDIEFLVEYDSEPPKWASGRALQGTNTERFMTGLGITDWDIKQFVDLLCENASSRCSITDKNVKFMTWLSAKPMEWHQELYALLYTDYLFNETGPQRIVRNLRFKSLQIIRLSNNEYSVGSECFFPSDRAEQDDVLPKVDVRTYTTGKKKSQQEAAKEFLKGIGVREVGEAEQIEAILKQRYMSTNLNPLRKDLKRFINLLEKEPDKANLFNSYFIFEGQDGKWRRPSQIFLDQPFMDTGLSAYYDALGKDLSPVALADTYIDCKISKDRLKRFAITVGVQTQLEISETDCSENPKRAYLHSVGGNRTNTSFSEDYMIVGLEKIFAKRSLAISKLVWQRMCLHPSYPDYLKARYQNNQSIGYREEYSTLVYQLRAAEWIPQGDGIFVRPPDANRHLLPPGFPFDPEWPWLKAIQFGEEVVKKSEEYRQKQSSAEACGFNSFDQALEFAELFKELKKRGISVEDVLANYKEVDFPVKESPNPERRAGKIADEKRNTPKKIRETREQTIDPDYGGAQVDAKTYLKDQYTDDCGIMFCQLCRAPQPVMLNGEPHFQAVDYVRMNDIYGHHLENNLALCPNHAAMYKNGGLDPDTVRALLLECKGIEIPLNLAGNELKLRFTKQHLDDLRAVLNALNSRENNRSLHMSAL